MAFYGLDVTGRTLKFLETKSKIGKAIKIEYKSKGKENVIINVLHWFPE